MTSEDTLPGRSADSSWSPSNHYHQQPENSKNKFHTHKHDCKIKLQQQLMLNCWCNLSISHVAFIYGCAVYDRNY